MNIVLSTTPKEARPWWDEPVKGPDPFHWKRLSDIKKVPIQWLWAPYIPMGAVTLIAGDGGYGKSWMTCALAADLSQGRPLPGQGALPPQKILMISAEDGLGEVIVPKMELLGANMENITCSDAGFTFGPETRGQLARVIKQYDAAVVFLDPLVVYLGGKVDMFRANETREMMNNLVEVAKYTGTAIVAVHHVRKSGEGSIQNKVMGSVDFVNGVRSALLVDVSKGGQRYMAHAKSNWSANGPPLAYSFNSKGFHWQGLYETTNEEPPKVNRNKRGKAIDWLRLVLSDGPVPIEVLKADAKEEELSYSTLMRAKDDYPGVVHTYQGKGGISMWALCPKELERMQLEKAPKLVLKEAPPIALPADPKARAKEILARLGK